MDFAQLKCVLERWPGVESQAHLVLEKPERVDPRLDVGNKPSCIRLWHYPAFHDYKVWTVYPGVSAPARAPKRPQVSFTVRELTWKKNFDYNRLADPEATAAPTISVRDGQAPEAAFEALLDEAGRLTIPVAPVVTKARFLGADGEYFGIRSRWLCTDVEFSLQWWCDGPEEMRVFTGWVCRLRGFLQRCVDSSE